MDFEAEIKKEFLLEANELIEAAEEAFLDFERDSGNLEIIDNIFRLFHTLKGSSFTAGFDQLGGFTHKVENLLSSIKAAEISVDDQVCNVLIESNDILASWVGSLVKNDDHIQGGLEDLEARLLVYQDSNKSTETSAPVPSAGFAIFDDEDDAPPVVSSAEETSQNSESMTATPQEDKSPDSNGFLAKVLVVDDEPNICELFELFLEELNIQVVSACDGVQGLELSKSEQPDAIITDLKMPNLDGIEFITKLREFDTSVPVIFISGAAEREDLIEFMALGSMGFIEKPINRDQMIVQVRNAIYIKKMKESVARVSMLNFKLHMNCYQLINCRDDIKKKKLETEVKQLLDQLSTLNNEMVEIKMLEIA